MFLLSIRKISKDDYALIKALYEEKNWSSRRLLREFLGENWARTSMDKLLKKVNSAGMTDGSKHSGCPCLRSVRMSEFRKTSNLWRSSSAVMTVFCAATKSVQN